MMLRAHNTLHRFFHILDGVEPAMSMGGLFAADDATMHVAKANLTLTGPEEIDAWCERGGQPRRWARQSAQAARGLNAGLGGAG